MNLKFCLYLRQQHGLIISKLRQLKIAASKNIEKEKLRKSNENMQKYFGDIYEPEKITDENVDAKIRAFSNMSFLFDKNGSYILTLGSDSRSGSYTYQPASHHLFLSNKGEQITDSSSVELSDTTLIIESIGSLIKTKFVFYRKN